MYTIWICSSYYIWMDKVLVKCNAFIMIWLLPSTLVPVLSLLNSNFDGIIKQKKRVARNYFKICSLLFANFITACAGGCYSFTIINGRLCCLIRFLAVAVEISSGHRLLSNQSFQIGIFLPPFFPLFLFSKIHDSAMFVSYRLLQSQKS